MNRKTVFAHEVSSSERQSRKANKRLNSWLEFWIFVLSTAVIVNNNPSAATPTYHQISNAISRGNLKITLGVHMRRGELKTYDQPAGWSGYSVFCIQATNCIGSPTLVSNYSSSIYPDLERCKLGIDQLRCRSGDIKACIPDLEGNVLAICTENICLPGNACPAVTIVKSTLTYRVQSFDGKCRNCSQYDNLKNRLQRQGDSKIIEEECLKAFNAYIMIKNITEKTTTSNPLKEISTTENSKPQSEKESGIIIIVYISVSIITFVAVGIFWCYKK